MAVSYWNGCFIMFELCVLQPSILELSWLCEVESWCSSSTTENRVFHIRSIFHISPSVANILYTSCKYGQISVELLSLHSLKVWNLLWHQSESSIEAAEQEDVQWRAPVAADPEVGWGAYPVWPAPGRGAGQGLPYHLPRGRGRVCLSPGIRVPAASQHISA